MLIPEFYQRLLTGAGSATLSVIGRDGSIQSTLLWPDYDGEFIKLNVLSDSPKANNIRRQGVATLLMAHPSNENMYITLRCELHEITTVGAMEHLDLMTQRNMGVAHWYGDVEPADSPAKEKCILIYLKPVRMYHT